MRSLAPLLDVIAGLTVSGIVLLLVGIDPIVALSSLTQGSLGYPEAIGYTLYYFTTYLFAGLSVWLALRAGLFNIGGEGQIYLGGLGAGLTCIALDGFPGIVVVPLACLGAIAFGAAWAFVPAILLAKRESSLVVTTIMFNFIASALMTWLLTGVMLKAGQSAPETPIFAPTSWMPSLTAAGAWFGVAIPDSPANLSLVVALAVVAAAHFVVGRTVWGYEMRTLGGNPDAALYAGINGKRITIVTLCIAGGCAGLAGVNEILGAHHRVILEFPNGAGFVGVAVGLMARRNAWALLPGAFLFAALAQGSVDLMIDNPRMTRALVVLIQGLIILFAGALRGQIRLPRLRSSA